MDENAKSAKNTKDAKVNAETQRNTKDAKKIFSVFSANFCVFCVFYLIGVNLCQSVDENHRLHRLAQIFSAESTVSTILNQPTAWDWRSSFSNSVRLSPSRVK